MDRRHVLGALTAGVAGLAFDPERLLWVPGKKTIFLPPVERVMNWYPDLRFHPDAFSLVMQPMNFIGWPGEPLPPSASRAPIKVDILYGFAQNV